MLKMNLNYQKGILFVRLKGNLNKSNAIKLNKHLIPIIMKHGIKFLVYNIADLTTIDKKGKQALLDGNKAISVNKGFAYICEIPSCLSLELKELSIQKTLTEKSAMELLSI